MEDRKGANAGERGVGFKDEFHSRLKFNRRGLLAMANEGKEGTNGSQFFITLGATPELQGKNTLFGRVEGETIYNVAKMGEMEVVEGSDRPVYPVKITGVEILVNPFKDMLKRVRVAELVREQPPEKKKKRKAAKQLLSFGDEEGEEEQPVLKKTKFDTRIVMDNEELESSPRSKPAKEIKKRVAKPVSSEASPEPTPPPSKSIPNRAAKVGREPSSSPEPVQKVSSLLDQTNAQIAELKASMKRTVQTAPVKEKKKSTLEEMIPSTSVRARKRGAHNNTAASDQKALDILKAFRSKLDQAPPEKEVKHASQPRDGENENGEADDDEEAALCDLHFIANCQSCKKWDAGDEKEEDEDDGIGWMSHALSFKEDKLGKDLTYRKKAEDELVVIDPREKARTLKEEMRAQREAKAGGGGRAWDQARNDKLARNSALAGRGAK